MKNHPVKNHLLSYCAASALFALLAASAAQANAEFHSNGEFRNPVHTQIRFRYDSAGLPIWSYTPCGHPIHVIPDIFRKRRPPCRKPGLHHHAPCRPACVCRHPRISRSRCARPCPPRHCRPCRPRHPFPGLPPHSHRRR